MIKTIHVEGMMCGHCEERVRKALEKIPGVISAKVSHEDGTATVTVNREIGEKEFKEAVEEQGYTML